VVTVRLALSWEAITTTHSVPLSTAPRNGCSMPVKSGNGTFGCGSSNDAPSPSFVVLHVAPYRGVHATQRSLQVMLHATLRATAMQQSSPMKKRGACASHGLRGLPRGCEGGSARREL